MTVVRSNRYSDMSQRWWCWWWWCWCLVVAAGTEAPGSRLELIFSVTENVPVGSYIGQIRSPNDTVAKVEPPFLIVPMAEGQLVAEAGGGSVDTDLNIDQSTGEIRTAAELDREERTHYSFIAISLTGLNVHVRINIEDVNDNAPRFPTDQIELELPENSKPRETKRTLPPAIDLDRAIYGTQSYRIISGNVANAFRLMSHREKDDILYLDLQVNGVLDRETLPSYNLVIEATDGGQPPLRDRLQVKIAILDHNDCEPVFSQSHYYGTVPENATLGSSVLKVSAQDNDEGDNGRIVYLLHSKNGAADTSHFAIDRDTGWIHLTKPLDYEWQDLHELVVIARDQGVQPLQTSALISIRVTDVNDNQPTASVLFLTANSKPEIREDAQPGDLVARISVNDADLGSSLRSKSASKRYSPYNGLTVSLFGAEAGEFGLRTADQIVYLVVVTGPLDRERRAKYQLTVVVSDRGQPPQNTTATFELEVTDVNDNPPRFDRPVYHITLPEATDIGSSVYRMSATDPDSDSVLTYAFLVPITGAAADARDEDQLHFRGFGNATHRLAGRQLWFSIDHRSGLVTTASTIDCETDPEPRLTVIVFDQQPVEADSCVSCFNATAELVIAITDINDNEPVFGQSFYNLSVPEDTPAGTCLLRLQASDADCGLNAQVNYSLEISSPMMVMNSARAPRSLTPNEREGDALLSSHQHQHDQMRLLFEHFRLDAQTGQLCLEKPLDYESVQVYDLPVLATDRGGLSTTAVIKVHVLDANDHAPVFQPTQYRVSVSGNRPPANPLVIVAATDRDSARTPFGQITYEIEAGNEQGQFDIDPRTGQVMLLKPLSGAGQHRLTITARDGAGLKADQPALVLVSVNSAATANPGGQQQLRPVFLQPQYNFQVIENAAPGAVVGTVRARVEGAGHPEDISYAIHSGDPDGYFTIDQHQGTISVRSTGIDRERHSYLLVNVQAATGQHNHAHVQVNITILDENDNVPMFPSPTLKISVPESVEVQDTVFVAYAIDYDSGQFGQVRYQLYPATSHDSDDRHRFPFAIEEPTGVVRLRRRLDYETRNEYQIRVVAIDGGQLSTEMLVHVYVQDVNDNAPIFVGTAQTIELGHSLLPLYRVAVPENVPINAHLHHAKATDADTGNNARLTYSLAALGSTGTAIPVDIFPNNGVLYARDALDRESLDRYELLVSVTDHGLPQPLNVTAVVHITVQDVNDNRPVWKQLRYAFELPEDAPVQSLVGQVVASDLDQGANGTLVYNLTDDAAGTFQINPTTGQIFLRGTLDRETQQRYELSVEVRDQGVPEPLASEQHALVMVTVLDVNDNRPVFIDDDASSRLSVPVGTARKTTVATFRALDPDAGLNGTVSYSLTEQHPLFGLDPDTGVLFTKIDINESAKRTTHRVSLLAHDGPGKKSKVKHVDIDIVAKRTLELVDLDYAEQYSFQAKRSDLAYGYRLGSVELPEQLVVQHQCQNRFFTNFHHQLRNRLPFFFEGDEARLHLRMFDQLDPAVTVPLNLLLCVDWAQCLVSVLDVNEVKGAGQQHAHQLVQCDHYARLNLQISEPDDTEHCLPLSIEDRDLFELKIPLGSDGTDASLLPLNHTCSDSESIHFELFSPLLDSSALNRMFAIEDNALHLTRGRDPALIQRYLHEDFVLSLVAKNRARTLQSVPVRVKLLGSDHRLSGIGFTNEKFVELEEDCCQIGSAIVQARLNVSHDDYKIKYYLGCSYGEKQQLVASNDQFSINPDTGLLHLRRELDFERKHEHLVNLTAVVQDSKATVATVWSVVRIKVLNTNDEPPLFLRRSYEREIGEDARLGQLLVQLEARDSDHPSGHSNVTYLLPKSYRYAEYFQLDPGNGQLKLARSLDRELIDRFYVPIYAFDEHFKHQASTLVTIKVLDVNDNAPYLVQPSFELKIPESTAPGTAIYTVVAIDPDLVGNASQIGLQYRISSGNTGNKFLLHGQTGQLTVNAPLDREMQSVYHLTVEVSDSFYHSSGNVTVELTDVNDNAPVFDKNDYYAMLRDGAVGWLNLTTVRAIDSDGDLLLYRLEPDANNLTRLLMLEPSTGQIRVHSSMVPAIFGALLSNVFTFEVSAVEASHNAYRSYVSRAKVHVSLIAEPGSGPLRLARYPYVITVDQSRHSLHVDQTIGQIELRPAAGAGARVGAVFRVINGGESYRSFSDYFAIQASGAVVVKRPLNYNYYEAIVEVTGDSSSTLSLVQIFIGGIDDRKMVQSIQLDSIEVPENLAPGTEILHLSSFLPGASSSYQYLVFHSDLDRRHFVVDQAGRLRLNQTLDYESHPDRIQVLVFAYRPADGNLHQHSYLYNCTVRLKNVDDNWPQFTQSQYVGAIQEGDPTGTFVAQVHALDIDRDDNRTYSYYIVHGNHDNAFRIDSQGVIRTNIVLDREIRDRYRLKVIATETNQQQQDFFLLADEASQRHLTQCLVQVIIIDQNDNVPVFPPHREISVSEDAPVGSVVATWTANDVDIYPRLSYAKLLRGRPEQDCFEIGLYTGKIYLKCPLQRADSPVRKVRLLVQASDQEHVVETELTVNVKRNRTRMVPLFRDGGNFYHKLNLNEEFAALVHEINVPLFQTPVIEESVAHRQIRYWLGPEAGHSGLYIDPNQGTIYNNRTMRFRTSRLVTVSIYARYQDSDRFSQASLVLHLARNDLGMVPGTANPRGESSYQLEIDSSQIGVPLLRLPKRSYANYAIISGNANKNFLVLRGTELVLVSRPLTDQYLLKLKPNYLNASAILVQVRVRAVTSKDSVTFASPFKSQVFELEVSESEKIGTEIQDLRSRSALSDPDQDSFSYRIFAGNELGSFRLEQRTGVLLVEQPLDYEIRPAYRLGVVAESHRTGQKHFAIINLNLINANEYCPQFASSHFRTLVDENSALGARVMPIRAVDGDRGDHQLNYTLIRLNEWNDSPFIYDRESGFLVTSAKLDYEAKSSVVYKFIVRALDPNPYAAGQDLQCSPVESLLEVQVGSVDEHSPQFVNEAYHFRVSSTAAAVGTRGRLPIGQVLAIDADSGPDGQVVYHIKNVSPASLTEQVHINGSTGQLFLSGQISANLPKQFSVIVAATSGRMNSLNSLTVVNVRLTLMGGDNREIELDDALNGIEQSLLPAAEVTAPAAIHEPPLPGWVIFLIVLLLLITFVLMVSVIVIRMHQQQQQQFQHRAPVHVGSLFRKIGPPFSGGSSAAAAASAGDPNLSPAYSVAHYGHGGVAPAPPCYNDVTTAVVAACHVQPEPGHSASSGRGSAEEDADLDDVDEEIRMINESSNYYTEDPAEQVTTIAEYLARLGVTNHYEEEPAESSSVAVDDDDGDDPEESVDVLPDLANKYGKRPRAPTTAASVIGLASELPQPTIHNEEELSGSYNWDYLQHWGPKYQPLSSVFAEIARLKSEQRPPDILENMSAGPSAYNSYGPYGLVKQQQQQQRPPPPPVAVSPCSSSSTSSSSSSPCV